MELWSFAGAEAQVAAIADDIAYDAHDIDDGLRAGLFSLDGPRRGRVAPRHSASASRQQHPNLEPARLAHELVRRLITRMIEDVMAETGNRLRALAPRSADDVRDAGGAGGRLLAGHGGGRPRHQGLSLSPHVPSRPHHAHHGRCRARDVRPVRALRGAPGDIPAEWAQRVETERTRPARLRRIADFIAGMTDRYALIEHARLFDSTPELR